MIAYEEFAGRLKDLDDRLHGVISARCIHVEDFLTVLRLKVREPKHGPHSDPLALSHAIDVLIALAACSLGVYLPMHEKASRSRHAQGHLVHD